MTIKWTPLPRPHFHLLFRFSVVVKSVSHIHWYNEESVITEPLFIHRFSGFWYRFRFSCLRAVCWSPDLLMLFLTWIAAVSIWILCLCVNKTLMTPRLYIHSSPKLNFKTPPSCLFSLMSDTGVKFSCKEVQDQTSALGSKQLEHQTVATSSQWHTAGNVYPQSAGK